MNAIIKTIGSPPGQRDSEVGATMNTEMSNVPRIGETLHYRNQINDIDVSVRVSDVHREIRVTKKGEVRESAIITGILTEDS